MSGKGSTWMLDRFAGGIDLRDGLYAENQARFRRLLNVYIDHGGKIRRRPPCELIAGAFDAASTGLLSIDGQLHTFAPKGTTIAHTGVVADRVETLYFDVPDLCEAGWELLAAQVFDGYAVALIAHDFPSDTYPTLVYLHVWDGLLYAPTFVQDPAYPGSFTPSITDLTGQEYAADFRPVLAKGVTKLWTSTLSGDAQASRTADPRVWNERTKDSLLEDGEWWCYVVPEGIDTLREFIVPRDAADLVPDARWAYYVLEYATSAGVWLPMEEVAITPVVGFTWRPVAVATRFTGGWDEIQVQVCWGQAAAGLVRLRLVAGATSVEIVTQPTVTATTGTGSTWNINVTAGTYRWRSSDLTTAAEFIDNVPSSASTYLLGVAADGFAELVNITSAFPNGWQREHRRWYKKLVFGAATAGSTAVNTPAWDLYPAQTGTVDVISGSANVVGTGTLFLTELTVGDTIRVNGEDRIVASIGNNLALTVTLAYAGTASGASIAKLVKHYARYSASETQVKTTLTSGVSVGDNLRINGVDYLVHSVDGSGVYTLHDSADTAGNFVANIDSLYTVTLTAVPLITDYEYAFVANENSAWYTERIVEYVDQAGAEDAVTIATSGHDNTGGKVSAIATVRNRMLVCYPGACQLWAVDQATSATQFLDQLSFGTGDQQFPAPVEFYGTIVIPTPTGWRSMNVTGANTDTLQDTNIGEPIQGMAMPEVRSAYFWPWFGQFVAAGTDLDGTTRIMCLDYSRESKISAWSQWSVAGLSDVVERGSFVVDQNLLYLRTGTDLLAFNATATVFRDFADDVATPYLSDVLWHYNDFGRPGTGKRITAFDIVQEGKSELSFQLPPYGSIDTDRGEELGDVPVSGITYGLARRGVAMTAQAIAPRLRSRDVNGWRLQRLAIDYLGLRR